MIAQLLLVVMQSYDQDDLNMGLTRPLFSVLALASFLSNFDLVVSLCQFLTESLSIDVLVEPR